jgi:signal transduction histidine kinase
MSRALLNFRQAGKPKLDAATLAAAIEASPEPMAIAENGKVIYSNPSFAQLSSQSQSGEAGDSAEAHGKSWRTTEFSVAGRSLALTTMRPGVAELAGSDGQHLAIVGRLVGGVAHDFNNLLTGILLYCDLLQTKIDPANTLWRKVDEIRSAAEHGAGIIRQLMTLGRDERYAAHAVSFNHVVLDLEPLLKHLLGEQVRIASNLTKESGLVGISMAEAQQIVLNLALNARDAMPKGGSVRFETSFREFEGTGPGERIFEFKVSDDGEGMDAKTAARIFEPFFTTKAPGEGTGMGLATLRKIVEDAGGSISVESSPGEGTRMMVRLPEVSSDAQAGKSLSLSPAAEKTRTESPQFEASGIERSPAERSKAETQS